MQKMPANIAAIAEAMIGVASSEADLDYTLELSDQQQRRNHGRSSGRGADNAAGGRSRPTQHAIVVALAHWRLAPVRALLNHGLAMTAPIAAALGRTDQLASLLECINRGPSDPRWAWPSSTGRWRRRGCASTRARTPTTCCRYTSTQTPLHQAAITRRPADARAAGGARCPARHPRHALERHAASAGPCTKEAGGRGLPAVARIGLTRPTSLPAGTLCLRSVACRRSASGRAIALALQAMSARHRH